MARDWRFELGRARATARIGFDYLRSLLLPVALAATHDKADHQVPQLTIRKAATSRPLPERIRVLCWNIHRAYDAAGVAAGLRAMMTDLEPQVLLMQEVPVYPDRSWWLTAAVRDLLADYHLVFVPMHRVSRRRPYYPFLESGLVIAARGGLERPRAVPLPTVSWPKLGRHHRVERTAVAATCRLGDVAVGIWNVHLENTARPSGRAHQARAVTAAIGGGPAILSGDFNTMFPPLEAIDRVLEDAGFSRPPLARRRLLMPQLDHFFVRGVRAVRSERLAVRGSDHRPIFGEFEIAR